MTPLTTPVTVPRPRCDGQRARRHALDAGHPTTVWNRSPGRADALAAGGASVAETVADAISTAPIVVACLFDHASVHDTLDPVADMLRGRTLLNLTTTTPNEARELATWATDHGADYLDGAIMAVPEMIGGPGSAIFTSGSATADRDVAGLVRPWGEATLLRRRRRHRLALRHGDAERAWTRCSPASCTARRWSAPPASAPRSSPPVRRRSSPR